MARGRKASYDVVEVDNALIEFAEAEQPITVRQAFYHLVSQGVIPKTEAAYKGIVGKRLSVLRDGGIIPYEYVADHTRFIRQAPTFSSVSGGLEALASQYRRDPWQDQSEYVQIWLEKDALVGVLSPVTREFAVPLLVVRGYSSKSFLHTAAERIKSVGKPTHIYYFGDHDPTGDAIPVTIQKSLREFGCEFEYTRVAVTAEQITELNLTTRPTKETDSRAKNWDGDESVEVDAIPPGTLREMVRECVERHIDVEAWEAAAAKEEHDLLTLKSLSDRYQSDTGDAATSE